MWILLWQLFCLRIVFFLWDTGKKLMAPKIQRKDYIIKNLSKACTLAVLTPNALWTAHDVLVHGRWSPFTFRVFGAMYSAHDIAGLIRMWDKLPSSTRAHHCSVVFMTFMSIFCIDYEDPTSMWRGAGMLGCTACWTFVANMFLALRLVGSFDTLRQLSFIIYAPTVALSTVWQISHVFHAAFHCSAISTILYTALLSSVVYDDVVLLRFLSKRRSPTSSSPDCVSFYRLWNGTPVLGGAAETNDPSSRIVSNHGRVERSAYRAGLAQ